MSKRSKLLTIAACLMLVLGLYPWLTFDLEAHYANRPLSAWLDDVQTSNSIHAREKAILAVRELGVQALPTLRRALQFRPTGWRKALLRWSSKLPTWMQQSGVVRQLDYNQNMARQFTALEIVRELGTAAAPLAPDLEKLASDHVEEGGYPNSYVALLTLKELGPGATPALANLLTAFNRSPASISMLRDRNKVDRGDVTLRKPSDYYDHDYRLTIIDAIREIGSGKSAAVLPLVGALQSTNCEVVAASARMLGEIKQCPEVVVPALVNLFDSPNQSVREHAALALSAFGNDALFALPKPQTMLDQQSPARNEVHHSIRRIKFATSGLVGEPDP